MVLKKIRQKVLDVVEQIKAWRATELNTISLYTKLLFYLGVWPNGSDGKGFGAFFRKLTPRYILTMNIFTILLGHPILTYQCWGVDNLHLLVECLSSFFLAPLMFMNIYSLMFRRASFDRIFMAMEEMRELGRNLAERPVAILERNRRLMEWILIYTFGTIFMIASSYVGMVPELLATGENIYHVWYPIDIHEDPVYTINFFTEFFCQAYFGHLVLFVNVLFLSFLAEAIGQLRILAHNLRNVRRSITILPSRRDSEQSMNTVRILVQEFHTTNINEILQMDAASPTNASSGFEKVEEEGVEGEGVEKEEGNEELGKEELRKCVMHHRAIMKFVDEIQSTYHVILFWLLICTLIVTGLGLILILHGRPEEKKRTMMHIGYIVSSYILTGLFCWFSDKICEEDEAVREAVYDCDWFEAPESFKRSIRIIMSRGNQPMVIKVMGFIPFTMETFYQAMQLTYKYSTATIAYFQETVEKEQQPDRQITSG